MGVWRTVRACLPQVIERQGYVLVIASLAAAIHSPGIAAYAASKAGAEAFADSLRVEVKHLGVDVGVGYFAFIDTDMVRGADAHPAFGELRERAAGPLGKTYPLSAVGEARGRGHGRERRRWVVVPSWMRGVLVLRTALAPLIDRIAFESAAEADQLFRRTSTTAASRPPRRRWARAARPAVRAPR